MAMDMSKCLDSKKRSSHELAVVVVPLLVVVLVGFVVDNGASLLLVILDSRLNVSFPTRMLFKVDDDLLIVLLMGDELCSYSSYSSNIQ